VALEQVFLRALRFPLSVSFHRGWALSYIIWGMNNRSFRGRSSETKTKRSMMFRAVFWVVLPCKMIVDRRFRGAYCLHHRLYCHVKLLSTDASEVRTASIIPLKRRSTIILHGSISQKTTLNRNKIISTQYSYPHDYTAWKCPGLHLATQNRTTRDWRGGSRLETR
jgi:hypothetical protein